MNSQSLVLIVDDEASIRRLLHKELSSANRAVHTAENAQQAREAVGQHPYDVLVLDIRLPDGDGLDLLAEFKEVLPDAETILITGHGDIDSAVEAMKIGAYDYITKPFNLDRLEFVIDKAYQRACLQRDNRIFRRHQQKLQDSHNLIGNSAAMKHIRFLIEKVAPTNVPVLVTGESGAGKEVVSRAVHYNSPRAQKPLVTKNCATLQRELARSELFGHIKGSFTGATENQEGLLSFAHKGSLFLDEIGELPLEVQASFLRVLENKTYRRVGEKKEREVDARLILATNRDLAQEVEAGRFHEALFHRINVFHITIPPLRERKEDIPLLVEFFLNKLAGGQGVCTLSPRAAQCLYDYQWPGNIRELRNVLERSIILSEAGVITEGDLPSEISGQHHNEEPAQNPLRLEAVEQAHIQRILRFFDYNRSQAAEALGVSRKTLYRKLQKYGLDSS
ncbi:sigma-54-dependent transcriptional regulator [Desulfohalobium retbaense]|uniref:Two component, sigma54 specific, transcriptional regulator, Fis family n=1 Tax=Desulfohalobium retbaense (strain ATCC 49708 / DSM 5692 / JCM 16813 / HR100) TaxID=485915 RepID=C8WZM7_DESRD|nr:sigma-54 dependent transcriptional regulator [Desulfohalobium retbaense]ACV67502.1 two component, sigma54 specific, transcriptional regulator, Fis family [Desulfohalobium retbaense DSM 5692]